MSSMDAGTWFRLARERSMVVRHTRWVIRWYGPIMERGEGQKPEMEDLGAGIKGFKVQHDGHTYIPFFEAVNPGNGDGGRFLDLLPKGARIPNPLTERLVRMLYRRGYRPHVEWAKDVGWGGQDDAVEVWER